LENERLSVGNRRPSRQRGPELWPGLHRVVLSDAGMEALQLLIPGIVNVKFPILLCRYFGYISFGVLIP
jgi:hypothetical protein